MLDLLKLKTFQVVAATSNFTRAAAELGYSQSSVTLHIQALERELGAPLFDRLSKNVILTEAGRRTLEYANRLIALANEAKAAAHKNQELSGPISVSAPEAIITYRLPEVLREFQAVYPEVRLTLAAHADSDTPLHAVLDGTLDLAVIVDERIRSDHLAAKIFTKEEILILKSPEYDFGHADQLKLEGLVGARILLTDKRCTFRLLFERVLSSSKICLTNILELGSIEAAKQCAMAGMGLAVLPKMAVTVELRSKRLVALPWLGPGVPIYLQAVRHRTRSMTPALHALWSLMEQNFAKNG